MAEKKGNEKKESENSEEKEKCKHSYQVVILVRVP